MPEIYLSCNLCGGREEKFLYEVFGSRLVKCPNCGLVYVNPRPDRRELVKIYDNNYFNSIGYRQDDESKYFGYNEYIEDEANISRKFQKKIKIIEGLTEKGRLLDIGSACGFFMNLARSRGWEVAGVEPSKFAAEYTRKRFGFSVHEGLLEDYKYPDEHFGAVTMWDVIEHLHDPFGSLLEINRIMKKTGVLGIITPDIGSLPARLLGRNWLEIKRVKEHIYFFSYATLSQMLKKAGFIIRERHSSGKFVKLKTIFKELYFMHWPLMGPLYRMVKDMPLAEKSFYVDPGYKVAVYAQKVKSL